VAKKKVFDTVVSLIGRKKVLEVSDPAALVFPASILFISVSGFKTVASVSGFNTVTSVSGFDIVYFRFRLQNVISASGYRKLSQFPVKM
jgi:hypothetical protein